MLRAMSYRGSRPKAVEGESIFPLTSIIFLEGVRLTGGIDFI